MDQRIQQVYSGISTTYTVATTTTTTTHTKQTVNSHNMKTIFHQTTMTIYIQQTTIIDNHNKQQATALKQQQLTQQPPVRD